MPPRLGRVRSSFSAISAALRAPTPARQPQAWIRILFAALATIHDLQVAA